MTNVEEAKKEVEQLEDRLEKKRKELEEAQEMEDLESAKDKCSKLRKQVDELKDDVRVVNREMRELVQLNQGDAFECEECGSIESYKNNWSEEEWEKEGLCKSCYREKQFKSASPEIREVLIGSEIADVSLNKCDTVDMLDDESVIGILDEITVELESGQLVLIDNYKRYRMKAEDKMITDND